MEPQVEPHSRLPTGLQTSRTHKRRTRRLRWTRLVIAALGAALVALAWICYDTREEMASLRTELGKLPGAPESLQPLLDRLPAEGAGLTLESLRGAGETQIAQTLQALATRLQAMALQLADEIGHRYFTLAAGQDELQRV